MCVCVRACVVCVCVYAYLHDARACLHRVLFCINFSTHALALLPALLQRVPLRGVVNSMRQARPVRIVDPIADSKYHTLVA
jgi:hypothetical protein